MIDVSLSEACIGLGEIDQALLLYYSDGEGKWVVAA